MQERNKGGRPAIHSDADELLRLGIEYIESKSSPTVTGLCLALGFESRQSFYDYENKPGFSYTIKTLRLYIENSYEERLTDKEYATVGVLFALKNLGWSDKQEVDHTTKGESINLISLGSGIKPSDE